MNSTKTLIPSRRRATTSAIASVRMEGLEPSAATLERLERYASGQITAEELQRETLAEVGERAAARRK